VNISRVDNRAEVRPEGDVVASNVDLLREELKKLIGEGIREMVLDMAAVEVIDSIGLGLIISVHNSLQKAGGNLTVINVSPDVLDLMRSMRLNRHFSVVGA
jgi:serine/threonine-protein kinase RsbW